MKTLAVCFNLPQLESNLCNRRLGKMYPGAGWIPHLVEIARNNQIDVLEGKQALRYVTSGFRDPREMLVIQEEANDDGVRLISYGATPAVMMCLESPIFTPGFYDNVDTIKGRFKRSILFSGGTDKLYFPSFDDWDLRDPKPFGDRDYLCMVMSNKHYAGLQTIDSNAFKYAISNQLHDYRYGALEYFHNKPGFHLYGRGWGGFAPETPDKLDTISKYKFALCFENGIYPGYMTEKIIDCLVAGVIPVYRGHMGNEVPGSCFIDSNMFDSFKDMDNYLRTMMPEVAEKYISAGQEWIRSDGMRHNCRVFAEKLMGMI